ncbi:MAG TPA: 6-bladed beta-propeller [bacterium]|nr:6-bladed beta-propeller [bacterium]HPN45501.1 6-bladed beta-propeller [bacterium]
MKKIIIMITCLLFITGLMNNVFAATVKVVDGITYIHNTKTPKFSQPTIELKEEWRIGGEDPGFIFNNPTCIDVDDVGRILVTDMLEHDVKIFSPNRKMEEKFGSQGNGPGEFDFNESIVSLSNDKLMIIDSRIVRPYNRFNYFTYDGTFIDNEDILLGAETPLNVNTANTNEDKGKILMESRMVHNARCVDGNLWLEAQYYDYMNKESFQALFWYDLQNKVSRQVYVHSKKDADLNADKMRKQDDRMHTEISWCENKNNTIAVIPYPYDYQVFFYNNSGALLKVISRDFTPPVKSVQQYKLDEKYAQRHEKLYTKDKVKYKVLKNNPIIINSSSIRGLFNDDKERLWVLSNESFKGIKKNTDEKSTYFYAFDIFDSYGEYLMRIPIKTHVKVGNFKYKNGYLYFFDIDNEGYLWLVKMRVVDRIK